VPHLLTHLINKSSLYMSDVSPGTEPKFTKEVGDQCDFLSNFHCRIISQPPKKPWDLLQSTGVAGVAWRWADKELL